MVYLNKVVVVCSDTEMSDFDGLLKMLRTIGPVSVASPKMTDKPVSHHAWEVGTNNHQAINTGINELGLQNSIFSIMIGLVAPQNDCYGIWHNRTGNSEVETVNPIEKHWLTFMREQAELNTEVKSKIPN